MGRASHAVQPSTVVSFLAAAACSRVLVVGDVMLDEYLSGPTERLSPEAPVPVVRVTDHDQAVGGAGHVGHVAARFGADVELVGVVGDDDRGIELVDRCRSLGIGVAGLVVCPGRPTTRKTRVVAGSQQIVRLDHESTDPLPASTRAALLAALDAVDAPDVIVVSDYAKGVVDDVVLARVRYLAARWGALVLVDPKDPDLSRYIGADVIKLNRAEFAAAVAADSSDRFDVLVGHVPAAYVRTGADLIVVTLGADGMAVFERGRDVCHIPASRYDVFDVTGAGDVVSVVVSIGLAGGLPPDRVAGLANLAAGVSVQHRGVSAVEPADLVAAVLTSAQPELLPARDEVVARAKAWRLAGERVAFTNGCFDLLHPGHFELLRRAAALGDRLVVAIDSDASVRRLKGDGRPLVDESSRASVIAALEFVDAVVVFDSDLRALIADLSPDVLVKGADYAGKEVVGRDLVEASGGRVELVPLLEGHSTTSIAGRLDVLLDGGAGPGR